MTIVDPTAFGRRPERPIEASCRQRPVSKGGFNGHSARHVGRQVIGHAGHSGRRTPTTCKGALPMLSQPLSFTHDALFSGTVCKP